MLKEFREFAMRGSVLDMAVGIIIGAAFGTIVSSMVADILMPPIGLLLGNVDFSNLFVILKAGQTKPLLVIMHRGIDCLPPPLLRARLGKLLSGQLRASHDA